MNKGNQQVENRQVIFHVVTNLGEFIKASCNNDLSSLIKGNIQSQPPLDNLPDSNNNPEGSLSMKTDDDTLFTIKQFADYFQVSQNSARAWIKKGLIPFIKINKRIRIRKAEILKLEKRRGEGKTEV